MKCKPYLMLATACFITACAITKDSPDIANKVADFPSSFLKINRNLKVPEEQPARHNGEQRLQKILQAPVKGLVL